LTDKVLVALFAVFAAFCSELLLTDKGGEDRDQSYRYFVGQFLPGHEVDIACATDTF